MRNVILLSCVALGVSSPALAAIPGQDPDWPCQQRLVPQVTAGTYWNGQLPTDGKWDADPRVAKLVGEIGSRDVTAAEGEAKIADFAKPLSAAERAKLLPEIFIGVVEETNRERAGIIDRIEELTRRQRDLAAIVAKASQEVDAIPADATGDDATRRAEAVQRRDFVTRTFEETQRTMRYACEVPAELDSRLGELARAMQNTQ